MEAIASGLKGGARHINEVVQERPNRQPLRVGSYPVLLSPVDWEPEPTEEELARKSRADLEQNPLYQAGEYLAMGAEEAYQPNPVYADSARTHAAEMAGGILPLVASGPMAPLLAGAQTTEDVYRSAYDAFKKAGYTDEEAYQNADRIGRMAGLTSGVTFFVAPLASQYLSRPIAGRMANELAKRAVKRALDGATLGAVDRGIQDAIALNTYNPNLSAGDIAKDMGRGAVVMGALGMGTGAVSDAAKDGLGKIGKILIQPEARGVGLKPAPIGKMASTEPGGEGIQASFASEHPRVRLEIETPDGRIVFMTSQALM
ncbi:MAG TPA: hypothetical protein VMF06_06930 [Candidatus Limnocylindria bacterium]|nr:hypothetical protein [Candidatus Limnocylindria bacterium]